MSEDMNNFVNQTPGLLTENTELQKVYMRTKNSIMNMVKNGTNINSDILKNVLQLVKNDCNSKDQNLKNAAKDMLQFLLNDGVRGAELDSLLLEFAVDSWVNKELSDSVTNIFCQRISESVYENPQSFDVISVFKQSDRNSTTKVIKSIDLITEKLSSDVTKRFLLEKVMPGMFLQDIDVSARDGLTQLGFKLLSKVPPEHLSPKEVELQIKRVSENYIQFVGHLRETDYSNWYQLWIFLVRFCGKSIHNSMELANKLLRVVEYAFRNTSYQQRLVGYECWKEFIDNASLDIDHMCSHKQIKLLVTPLKAKFSKMEVVICKRFDVFIYLLEKLQQRSVLCLNEFLEFCFGPLSENADVSKTGQGKAVSQLWGKSTRALMELLGHSHSPKDSCLEGTVIKLTEPVLNSENITNFIEIIIKAISECFMLLKDWCNDETQKQMVIKCLWGSLLNIIMNCNESKRKACSKIVVQFLDIICKKIENEHIKTIVICIMDKSLGYNKDVTSDFFTTTITESLLKIFFTTPLSHQIMEKIVSFIYICITSKSKNQCTMALLTCFYETEVTENVGSVCRMWLLLDDLDDFKNYNVSVEKMISFLMWPVYHYHVFEEEVKKIVLLNWAKIYTYLCNDSESSKCLLLHKVEKFFKGNPLRSGTIITFVAIISQFERNHDAEFVTKFFKLCGMVLTLPTLPKEDLLKLCSVLLEFMDLSLPFYDVEDNDIIIKSMCTCFEHVLKIHKHYELLDSLGSCLKIMPNKLKARFLMPLLPILEKLITHDDSKVIEDAALLLTFVRDEDKEKRTKSTPSPSFQIPNSRASKIASMMKDNDKSSKIAHQNTLQLLNTGVETTTPIKIKGSLLSISSPKRGRKILNALPKREARPRPESDSSTDYVPINTVVKFQPDKLSEHQKEVMKRRREDIPALYQDLSQSQSQDLFKSGDSNSKSSSNFTAIQVNLPDIVNEDFAILQSSKIPPNATTNEELVEDTDAQMTEAQELKDNDVTKDNLIPEVSQKDVDEMAMEEEKNTVLMNEDVRALIEDNKNQGYMSDTSITSNDSAKGRKKKMSKIEIELNRIRMDIVGGDKFVQNLPSRRTRSAVESEKIKLRSRKSEPTEKKSKLKKRLSQGSKGKMSPKRIVNGKKKVNSDKAAPRRLSFPEIQSTSSQQNAELEIESATSLQNEQVYETDKEDARQNSEPANEQVTEPNEKDEDSVSELNALTRTQDQVTPPGSPPRAISPKSPLKSPKSPFRLSKSPMKPPNSPMKIFSPKSPRKIFSPKSPAKALNNDEPAVASSAQEPMEIDEVSQNTKALSVYDFKETQEDDMIDHCYASFERRQSPEKKRKSSDESPKYSEDIIESSQESYVNLNPTLSPTKRKMSREKSGSLVGKKLDETNVDHTIEHNEGETPTDNDTETCESVITPPLSIQIVVQTPKKPELTDSEKEMCRLDTESFTSIEVSPSTIRHIIGDDIVTVNTSENTPSDENSTLRKSESSNSSESEKTAIKILEVHNLDSEKLQTPVKTSKRDSLPTSPVTGDTPIKTSEFIKDTMNISPINFDPTSSASSSDEERQVNQKSIESQWIEEINTAPLQNKESNDNKFNNTNFNEEKHTKPVTPSMKSPVPRSTKLLNMINVDSPVSHRVTPRRKPLRVTMSPATGRIKKLMSHFHTNKQQPSDEVEAAKLESTEDILTFTREVPSPFATPRVSILKRKLPDDADDGVSPCPKRKRVNFSDPTTTSKKVFIKYKDELPTYSPERITLPVAALFRDIELDDDDDMPIVEAENPENRDNVESPPKIVNGVSEPHSSNAALLCNGISNHEDQEENVGKKLTNPVNELPESNSENSIPTTAGSIDIINPVLLKNKPIYPNLISCEEDLLPILKKVTSPMFVTSLLKDLNKKNVKTVGDLAKLTEAEVNRLPFKSPAVSNVFKSLDAYYQKKVLIERNETVTRASPRKSPRQNSEVPSPSVKTDVTNNADCNVCPNKKSPVKKSPAKTTPKKLSPTTQPQPEMERRIIKLRDLMEWADLSSKEDATHVVNKLLGRHRNIMLPLIRDFYKANLEDVIQRKDMKIYIDFIIKKIGFSEMIELISETNGSNSNESVSLDSIVKNSIGKMSVDSLLQNKSIDDISKGIQLTIEKQKLSKVELISKCLIPLIKTPEMVSQCFSHLSMIQVGDILIKRMSVSDVDVFIEKITNTFGNEAIYNSVNKNEILEMCSSDEMLPVLMRNNGPGEIVRFFEKAVDSVVDKEAQNEMLINMFKVVSSKLSLKTLTNLHIEFIQDISNRFTD